MGKDEKGKKSKGKSDLRSKFKQNAASISELKNRKKDEDSQLGYSGAGDYLEVSEGSNKFRLFPSHDGPDFMVMRKVYWVDIPDENGEPKRRTVNDSIVHGGTEKDIFQEYIKFVQKHVKDKEILDEITAYQKGLQASFTWVAYALKLVKDKREFGLVEFKKSVRDQLNKQMFTEDDDDPIEVDPYTDPDDGAAFIVTYIKKPNKKKGEDFYTVSVKKPVELTDEELEVFEKQKPLQELYRNTYSLKEFDKAMEALTYFDEVKGIDIFDDDRWLEIVEEVKSQYSDSEDEDEDDEDEKPKKKAKKVEPKKASKKSKEDDDDEDSDDEDEEEEKPKKKSSKKPSKKEEEDEDDDDEEKEEKPKKKASKKPPVDEDEDDEDEEEEKPKKKAGMTMEDIRAKLGKGKK